MRKILYSLILICIVGLAGCDNEKENGNIKETETAGTVNAMQTEEEISKQETETKVVPEIPTP